MYQTLCRVALVMLALATLCLHRASACSCGSLPNAPGNCAEFKATGPSFVGTVIDIENPPDERRGTDESGLTRYRSESMKTSVDLKRRRSMSTRGEVARTAVTIFDLANRISWHRSKPQRVMRACTVRNPESSWRESVPRPNRWRVRALCSRN